MAVEPADDYIQGGGVHVVAAAAGQSHTILLTADGRIFVFGEGAAVSGADPATLESVVRPTGEGEGGAGEGRRGLVKRSEDTADNPLNVRCYYVNLTYFQRCWAGEDRDQLKLRG